jgi:Flp pilus assembly protein TadD
MATIPEALAIAVQHHQAGRLQAAEQIYRQILAVEPNHADAWHLLGVIAHQAGKHEVAVEYIGRAIGLNRTDAAFHNNLGGAYHALRRIPEAIVCYRRALELKPDYAEAHNNLGIVLKDQGRLDEAVACYRRALELKPDYAEAHNNLGALLNDKGKLDEAVACFRRALELKPDFAEARGSQSLMSLLTGDFERGWADYEWRWKTKQCPRRDFSQALWDGQPLEGRTILLHAEQGLGDCIQFVRYVPLVKQRGGAVIVECPKPLLSLLTSCAGIDRLVGRGDELPAFDVQAPLLSLPGIFQTALRDIPATIPYLFADPSLVERWRQELGGIAGSKIGMAWRGSPEHRNDRARSIPLSCFEPLAGVPGIHLVSLQKGAGAEELQEARGRFPVTDVGSRLEDFMDTAAVMVNLDLAITCDTAVAHLAGALGLSVWVAIPFAPDWRWLLDRSDSPWYPTMRLFRQDRRGDWQGVFRGIEAALREQMARQAIPPNEEF